METYYEVEMLFFGGDWENCWLDERGVHQRFSSFAEALEELNSHLSDLEEAIENGDLIDGSDAHDFRIIKANREVAYLYGGEV